MAIETYRIGAAQVYVPSRVNVTVPALTSLTTAMLTAVATTPDDLLNNSTSPTLDTTANYYVALVPLGEDRNVGGLTWAGGSTAIGPITVTDGQGIVVSIAATAMPANIDKAFAMGVMLRKNNGTYKLVDYAYIDTDNGFNYMVMSDADTQTGYSLATLMSTAYDSSYPELGDREAYGCTFTRYRTSGGVEVDINSDQVNLAPDDGTNFSLPTSRVAALRFSIMQNDMKQIVQATAGKYGSFRINGHTISVSNMSFASAIAAVTGNIPFKLVLPPDANKIRQIELFLACISTNAANVTLRWAKDGTTLVPFNVNPVNLDPLLQDVSTQIGYKFRT